MSPRVLTVRETVGVRTSLRVNDTTHELSVDSRLTLLDALRDVLGLTGTKKGAIRAHAARVQSSSTASVSCHVSRWRRRAKASTS